MTNPGTMFIAIGQACSLPIQASDSASGQTLTYTATGLPTGLSINSSTGLISGAPTTAEASQVIVTAADTTGAFGTAKFIINVVSATLTNPCGRRGPSASTWPPGPPSTPSTGSEHGAAAEHQDVSAGRH